MTYGELKHYGKIGFIARLIRSLTMFRTTVYEYSSIIHPSQWKEV